MVYLQAVMSNKYFIWKGYLFIRQILPMGLSLHRSVNGNRNSAKRPAKDWIFPSANIINKNYSINSYRSKRRSLTEIPLRAKTLTDFLIAWIQY
jgi:hypothetical protein